MDIQKCKNTNYISVSKHTKHSIYKLKYPKIRIIFYLKYLKLSEELTGKQDSKKLVLNIRRFPTLLRKTNRNL